MHFDLAEKYKLPMYLHSRNCKEDFVKIVKANRHKFSTACVHSYTGDLEELEKLLEMDLYIGVNGCSLKTEENIEVMKHIPLSKLMLESKLDFTQADCPYCEVNKSHAGYNLIETQFTAVDKKKWKPDSLVKGRNEPCRMIQVAEIVAKSRKEDIQTIIDHAYQNSVDVFGGTERLKKFGGLRES